MNDQVAIITGAASGVGRHFATELRRRTARAPAGLATALLQEPENDRRHP
jgi:NAD(P)-dependent dehydrogenase (short-subunit alcohol dehydrogenase family)